MVIGFFSRLWRTLTVGAMVLVAAGCATNKFAEGSVTGPVQSLHGQSVYVYSFLDVRDAEFGRTMLAELDRQLSQTLSQSGVRTNVLQFRDTPVGRTYTFGDYSGVIPVDDVVRGNRDAEQSIGARYRLIVFPSDFRVVGSAQGYVIRWSLVDVATGGTVWSTVSAGSRTIWMRQDESASDRARQLVDGLVAEMKKSGIL